jgi:ParB family chromosome partitioning protein
VDNFLGRVTKARILQAVAEAKGQRAADRIEHLKKGDMAAEAETLLADTCWLPESLRTQKESASTASPSSTGDDKKPTDGPIGVETATDGYETVVVEPESTNEDEPAAVDPSAVAAE